MTGPAPTWQPTQPRHLNPDDPVIASTIVPSGPGPLMARFIPPPAGPGQAGGDADIEITADLVFHVTGPQT